MKRSSAAKLTYARLATTLTKGQREEEKDHERDDEDGAREVEFPRKL